MFCIVYVFFSGGPIDPVVVKSLCGQIEKLTSMLVKVDEDIDDLDQRTEENRQQVDNVRLVIMIYFIKTSV